MAMFSASAFQDLVSGRRGGVSAALSRAVLRAAEAPYSLAVTLRNRRYDSGRAAVVRAGVPVISVGNLTLGGTGKTPFVAWLARWFRRRDVRVSIVSRGYGAADGAPNDEALELEEQLPDVPHVQNADRVAAAQIAVEELETQLILLDDGFQHRRLARDLDIVLIDALAPWGYGHVFPRGLLREPASGLNRAQVVALSRADLIDAAQRQAIRSRAQQLAPSAAWVEVAHAPARLIGRRGPPQPIETLRGQRLGAFCGLGNPAGFYRTLAQCGYDVMATREFPDHHAYRRDDIHALGQWADRLDVAAVVCTHKDLVKVGLPALGNKPLWALQVEMQVLEGLAALEERLECVCRSLLP